MNTRSTTATLARVTDMLALRCIGSGSVYGAVRKGHTPATKIGKRVLVPRRALERLLSAPDDGDTERTPVGAAGREVTR